MQTDVQGMDAQALREAAIQFTEAIHTNNQSHADCRPGLHVELKHEVLDYCAPGLGHVWAHFGLRDAMIATQSQKQHTMDLMNSVCAQAVCTNVRRARGIGSFECRSADSLARRGRQRVCVCCV